MYAKLREDNTIADTKNLGDRLTVHKVYSNLTEKELIHEGYKLVVESEMPSYDEEKEYLVEVYTETENSIVKSYNKVAYTQEELEARKVDIVEEK